LTTPTIVDGSAQALATDKTNTTKPIRIDLISTREITRGMKKR
jgi:hypothetical protein